LLSLAARLLTEACDRLAAGEVGQPDFDRAMKAFVMSDERTKAVTSGLQKAREAADKAAEKAEAEAAGAGAGPDGAVAAAKKALAAAQARVEEFAKHVQAIKALHEETNKEIGEEGGGSCSSR
jgi:hypothetical protein